MAFTIADTCRLAMQRLRLLAAGEQPTAAEAADNLIGFQSMLDSWATSGLFGRLNDIIPTGNYTAFEQDRVINDGTYTITLPTVIQPTIAYSPFYPDSALWGALTTTIPRPPRDLAQIEVITGGVSVRSIYTTHLRAWTAIQSLALTDIAPLSNRGVQGLASCLALQIADDYEAQASAGVQRVATMFMFGLSARYGSQRRTAMQDYF